MSADIQVTFAIRREWAEDYVAQPHSSAATKPVREALEPAIRAALNQEDECPDCEERATHICPHDPGPWDQPDRTGRKKPAENLSAPGGDASPVAPDPGQVERERAFPIVEFAQYIVFELLPEILPGNKTEPIRLDTHDVLTVRDAITDYWKPLAAASTDGQVSEALDDPEVRAKMVNVFMWAVTEGPNHPDASAEKAVEEILKPLRAALDGGQDRG